jgi:hypothetical protein
MGNPPGHSTRATVDAWKRAKVGGFSIFYWTIFPAGMQRNSSRGRRKKTPCILPAMAGVLGQSAILIWGASLHTREFLEIQFDPHKKGD